ncbi:MAG: hypothetical protein Kow0060_20900 [Methylohalobius crimeensis]
MLGPQVPNFCGQRMAHVRYFPFTDAVIEHHKDASYGFLGAQLAFQSGHGLQAFEKSIEGPLFFMRSCAST